MEGLFVPGQRITVADYNHLRRTPGCLHKSFADVLAILTPDTRVLVLAGPTVCDGLDWWQVRHGRWAVGWVAQTTPTGIQLLKSSPLSGEG